MNTLRLFVTTLWLTVLSSPVLGQTADDPTSQLVEGLHHRRAEVREKAFEALLEQARTGAELAEAGPVLRGFANLKFKEKYGDSTSFKYQASALRVLVTMDDQVAHKLLARTRDLVTAYERAKAQGGSHSELHSQLRNAFSVLQCVDVDEINKEASALATRVLKLEDYSYATLLPVVYKAYAKASERIQVTRDLGLDLTYVYEPLLAGIFSAEIDASAIDYLADLPEELTVAQRHAYLLGLLASQSEKAKQIAVRIMEDGYEEENIRHAVASGILAAASPENSLYWQADALCDEMHSSQYRYLDVGPEFNHDRHQQLKEAHQTAKQPPASKATPQPISAAKLPGEAPKQTLVTHSEPQPTFEDGAQFHKIFIPLVGQVRSVACDGRIITHVPQRVFDKLKSEQIEAEQSGDSGVARILKQTIES